MNLKNIRKTQIVATVKKFSTANFYHHGETGTVDASIVADQAEKALESNLCPPKMVYDADRREYVLRYHSNEFYTFRVA